MEIIERSKIFNDNFRAYSIVDTSNYLQKLLEFIATEDGMEEVLTQKTEEFQKALLEYILSQETDEDYESDIDVVRKERIENLLYDINNYLASIEPYDGAKMFMDGNFKELFLKATIYCDSYRKTIKEKVNQIISNSKLEYKTNIVYKKALDLVVTQLQSRSNKIIFYSSMTKDMTHINKETSLKEYDEYVDSLLTESTIINKFGESGRLHITNEINKTVEHPEIGDTAHFLANICESILTNYVFLDLYSIKPESLIISDKMLESILMEVDMGTVTKDDILQTIVDGPVQFTEEEIEYLKRTFMTRMFHYEEKNIVDKVDLLKLVK